jgi:predicted nucleic acid-binding protein
MRSWSRCADRVISAIDTSVLIDLLDVDGVQRERSRAAFEAASLAGALILSEVTYAELAPGFESASELDRFLDSTRITLVPSGPAALHRAGRAWRAYLRGREPGLTCPNCGSAQSPTCAACGSAFSARQHVVADFIIGAHALVHADRLLTRDRRYYASFFPDLVLA